MTKKYIFVDVDGVLNADKGVEGAFDTTGTVNGATYRLRLNKNHGKWLNQLAENTNSELVWGTTWMEYANEQIGKQIGLPEMPVAKVDPRFQESVESWKSRGVVTFADGNPFVWFDDMGYIQMQLDAMCSPEQFKFIQVTPMLGLREKHIVLAHNWLSMVN